MFRLPAQDSAALLQAGVLRPDTRSASLQVRTLLPNVALHHGYITEAPKQKAYFLTSTCTNQSFLGANSEPTPVGNVCLFQDYPLFILTEEREICCCLKEHYE